jgi:hypothetical protein
MILERPGYETIIGVEDFSYLASIEEHYPTDDNSLLRYIRIGHVGFEDSIMLYPDQINGLRRLLDAIETYVEATKCPSSDS